jgi:lipopolysaccharide export system protein LptC
MTDLIEARPAPRRIRFDPTGPRPGRDYGHAERHSRRVRWLKIALPTIAAVAVVGFFLAIRFEAAGEAVSLAGINIEDKSLVMKAPHISGFEGTRQAYEVHATRAIQDLSNPKVVTLQEIVAKFGMQGGGTATVDAAAGVYDGNANLLTLKNGIAIATTDGYHATMVDAKVDVKGGTLVTQKPLEIHSADGMIKANGVQVSDRGKHILFTGGVTVNFVPPPDAAASLMPGAAPAPANAAAPARKPTPDAEPAKVNP